MSAIPIGRSPDLLRLRRDGYNIHVTSSGWLIVRDVPYLNHRGQVCRGALATPLDLAGDITTRPSDHTIRFIGEHPCDDKGVPIRGLVHGSGDFDVGDGLRAQQSFSSKPARGHYLDYHEKIVQYVGIIGKYVAAVDREVRAQTGKVFEPRSRDSPFNYLDTNSARAEIGEVTAKLAMHSVAIVGLGGTGSYILDLVAKTPIAKIHLYDDDAFLTHNAFRAPGAPAIDQLRSQIPKVEYLAGIYSRMHRGIVAHPVRMTAANIAELADVSFVFLCLEGGANKRLIVERLEQLGIPFIDVGMALYAKRQTIGGQVRTVASLPDNRDIVRADISLAADNVVNEYDKNIQVADLNALNACLAVIKWKKFCSFYFDQKNERFSCYRIAGNILLNDAIP